MLARAREGGTSLELSRSVAADSRGEADARGFAVFAAFAPADGDDGGSSAAHEGDASERGWPCPGPR